MENMENKAQENPDTAGTDADADTASTANEKVQKTPVPQKLTEKLKAALHVFTQSLTSPKYYRKLIQTDFKFSAKYYVVLVFISVLATSLYVFRQIIPDIEKEVADDMSHALYLLEEDLVITIKEGKLSINKEEPYIIPMPDRSEDAPANLVVFDTEGTIEDLEGTYDTLVLVNDTNVLTKSGGRLQVYPVSSLPEGEFSQGDLLALIEQLRNFVRVFLYVLSALFFVVVLVLYMVLLLVYLLSMALLLWFLGLLLNLSLDFIKYYKIALHSVTLPLCLLLLSSLLEMSFASLAFHFYALAFLFVHLIFGGVVVFQLRSNENVSEEGEDQEDFSGGVSSGGSPEKSSKDAVEGEVVRK
ncbi:DUF1189 domain-containing protein [candidate division WWE3 bacterium]|nr:DUF1189 domain-containing protein [candidate division WWE3 bacterium]